MIDKLALQSIIGKYRLDQNESVKWVIKNKNLSIDFMNPTKDVIGNISYDGIDMEDIELAIFDSKKLLKLISICDREILLQVIKEHKTPKKLKISDSNFEVEYALSDLLLIDDVASVNEPSWDIELELNKEHILNLIKSQEALVSSLNVKDFKMYISTIKNHLGDLTCEFLFGDEGGHNNHIKYTINGNIKEDNIRLPFNSDLFRLILKENKGMEFSKIKISGGGLMKLEFNSPQEKISSKYFLVRQSETNF